MGRKPKKPKDYTIIARVKDGVWTNVITFEAIRIIQEVSGAYERIVGRIPTITSWMDGKHIPNSRHFYGLALDFRTWGLTEEQKRLISAELYSRIGEEFDIVFEPTHLHVEYDPKT